ncbi:MAG: hypothetical protein CMN30_13605 [Sandaracinus sp.]|nr:hypothetical protein [Sandaracinus sp.]|tara:strand:+ start:1564 stop:2481 length:918 start_codon:yes stop_codon:yes gene_type:complete
MALPSAPREAPAFATLRAMIVCGTDLGSSGETAARWAAALARASGQDLVLVHVDGSGHEGLESFPEAVREAAATMVERLDDRRTRHETELGHLAASLGMDCERVVLDGRPWERLVDYAAERRATLLIVGPHAAGLGSTSRNAAVHSPCPVLVAGTGEPPEFSALPWVVGIPHGHAVAQLLHDVGALAATTGSALVPTRILPRIPDDSSSAAQTLLAEMDAVARQELQRLVENLGVPVTLHVASGTPATVLLEEARGRGAGIAVTAHSGERPRDALRRFFLGSVTERILRGAETVPVFISPPVPTP